jgi:hypothetical protein
MKIICALLLFTMASGLSLGQGVAKAYKTFDSHNFLFEYPSDWSFKNLYGNVLLFCAPRNKTSKSDSISIQFDFPEITPKVSDSLNIDSFASLYTNNLKDVLKDFKILDQSEQTLSQGNIHKQLQATFLLDATQIYIHIGFEYVKAREKILTIKTACYPKVHERHKTEINHVLATFQWK